MKRDMDLIRSILLTVEDDQGLTGSVSYKKSYGSRDFPGYDSAEVGYHIELLAEAGLLEVERSQSGLWVSRLTWKGHEFISTTKDPDIWQRVKGRMKVVTDVALPILTELATDELKKKLGLA